MISSNDFRPTKDLLNRCSLTRIAKPKPLDWPTYKEGGLLEHVWANQPYYLGCIHSLIKCWASKGFPTTKETSHDFIAWAQALDWITQNLLPDGGGLLENYDRTIANFFKHGHLGDDDPPSNEFSLF
jgi:hypothetical protein